jgi:hypothetical protein
VKTRAKPRGAFSQAVIRKAVKALLEYCKEDSIPKSDYGKTLRRLQRQDFKRFDDEDWWFVYDSMGTRSEDFFDDATRVFYKCAHDAHWLPLVEKSKLKLAERLREATG